MFAISECDDRVPLRQSIPLFLPSYYTPAYKIHPPTYLLMLYCSTVPTIRRSAPFQTILLAVASDSRGTAGQRENQSDRGFHKGRRCFKQVADSERELSDTTLEEDVLKQDKHHQSILQYITISLYILVPEQPTILWQESRNPGNTPVYLHLCARYACAIAVHLLYMLWAMRKEYTSNLSTNIYYILYVIMQVVPRFQSVRQVLRKVRNNEIIYFFINVQVYYHYNKIVVFYIMSGITQ